MSREARPLRIALCGRSGVGKTTVAEYLRDLYGFHVMRSGEICREFTRRLFDLESKEILNQLTDAVRQIDPDVWIKAALRSLPDRSPAVFDSARFAGDEQILAGLDFKLVRIDCSLDLALERLVLRGQHLSADNDFEHETETNFLRMAPSFTLRNSADLDSLRAQVDDLIVNLTEHQSA